MTQWPFYILQNVGMCASVTFQSRQQLDKCQRKHDLISKSASSLLLELGQSETGVIFSSYNPSVLLIVTDTT